MVGFYDIEVFPHDWIVVFQGAGTAVFHNDKERLRKFMDKISVLVGFNNHHYDDIVLLEILNKNSTNSSIYQLSKDIIQGKRVGERKTAKLLPSIDTRVELDMSLSLKEIEANLGLNIEETPVDFDLPRPLTEDELETVVSYCMHDVSTTMSVYEERETYFKSKMEVVNEFKLNKNCIKFTRAQLATTVLECHKMKRSPDRLDITFIDNLEWDYIPKEIADFYQGVKEEYSKLPLIKKANPKVIKELESRYYECDIAGVPHKLAFGGIHGARKRYKSTRKLLNIDVGSYYPTLMINNKWISRNSRVPEKYIEIYHKRLEYKRLGDPKADVYKIVLNALFGALKQEGSEAFDPVMSNNICINGQLLLVILMNKIKQLCKIVQSNTDGILIEYEDKYLEEIKHICKDWEKRYNLTLDYQLAKKVIQRDVNNYLIYFENGKVKSLGMFKASDGGNFEKNNLSIVATALREYYINNTPIERTIYKLLMSKNLEPFQLVAKKGSKFDKIIHNSDVNNGEYTELQNVNRLFACVDDNLGMVYKVKLGTLESSLFEEGIEKESRTQVSNCPPNVIVHNGNIEDFNMELLDIGFYEDLIARNMI